MLIHGKDKCKRGHLIDPLNEYINSVSGSRQCLLCARLRAKQRYDRLKQAKKDSVTNSPEPDSTPLTRNELAESYYNQIKQFQLKHHAIIDEQQDRLIREKAEKLADLNLQSEQDNTSFE